MRRSGRPARGADRTNWWLACLGLVAVLLIPLLVTEIPPLLDYPNHLARMEILAHRATDPALSRIYRVNWRILPNIGIDLALPPLLRLVPLAVAGKVFVALALVLPLAGVAALHRAIFRYRSYWPLAAGLVVYNRLFFAGFLNFLIGIGLALLAASLWRFLGDRKPLKRSGQQPIASVVIFFCHLIALAFYALLLIGLELARSWETRSASPVRFALLAIPFAVPVALYLIAPIAGIAPAGGHGFIDAVRHYYWALAASPRGLRFYGLAGPFLTYDRRLDFAAIALAIGLLLAFAATRRLRVAPAVAGPFCLLLAAYPFVPFFLMETAWVNQRLPIMAGFLLFAGTQPIVGSPRTAKLMAAALTVAILGRTAEIANVWAGHDAEVADFRQTVSPVAPTDRVLVVQAERNADPNAMVNNPDSVRAMRDNDSTAHLPGLLVIERKAFWPLLFTAPAKQPVEVLPPYDTISLPEGELPWIGALAHPGAEDLKWAPYLPDWEDKFDWVLVLRPADAANGYSLLPDRLEPVAAGKIAALYRVLRPPLH